MPTPITSYLDIISLERAKNYLRIDDPTSPHPDDVDIASMIKGAFLFIERYTNHIFGARDFEQYGRIYKTPINSISIVNDIDWDNYYQRNYDKLYGEYGKFLPNQLTQFNAGYINVEDVPDDFIQAALQMIKVWYYESEKQVNSTLIPISVTQILDTYRTFV